MRASFVCFKKVFKVGKASSAKCSLRVRMQVVSTINYYKNIKIIPRHTTCFPSYRHKAFPTQISRKLLTGSHAWSILPFTGEPPVDKEGFQALLPDNATCTIIPRSRLEGHPAPGQAMTSGPGKHRAMPGCVRLHERGCRDLRGPLDSRPASLPKEPSHVRTQGVVVWAGRR